MEKRAPRVVLEHFNSLGAKLFYYELTDSTNKRAREYCNGSFTLPAVFFANGQSEGRGRMGRSFFSPDSTGLYMTLLVEAPPSRSFTLLTSVAAVAVREAISRVFGVDTRIKWVNDIYLGSKKVAGILAESFVEGEKRYVAIGVGVNLTTRDFPSELSDKAGAIVEADMESEELDASRFALAFEITRGIFDMMKDTTGSHIGRYRKYSCVLGKRVSFVKDSAYLEGVAIDIGSDGELIVVLDSGETQILSTGEISLSLCE